MNESSQSSPSNHVAGEKRDKCLGILNHRADPAMKIGHVYRLFGRKSLKFLRGKPAVP
jgi:hypothetical protein